MNGTHYGRFIGEKVTLDQVIPSLPQDETIYEVTSLNPMDRNSIPVMNPAGEERTTTAEHCEGIPRMIAVEKYDPTGDPNYRREPYIPPVTNKRAIAL